jgi:putative FmdB family regulatory protein
MAFYDYKCTKCNHTELDVKRPIIENVSTFECPKCGGEMKQLYTLFGFELKGDNWFKDGYSGPAHVKQKEKIDDLHR